MGLSWKLIPVLLIVHTVIQYLIILWISANLPSKESIKIPFNLEEAKLLIAGLQEYADTHFTLILILQSWCIPGTVFFNLMGGAIFGLPFGVPVCLFLNTIGACTAFLISKYFGEELKNTWLKKHLIKIEGMIASHKSNLFFYLTFLRIVPFSPNWAMNITFPHMGIPLYLLFITVGIGIAPWNYVSCSAGLIIKQLATKNDIMSWEDYAKMILLAFMFLIPPLIKGIFTRRERKLSKQISVDEDTKKKN